MLTIMKKISRRDIKFFLLGLFTMFAIEVATDWEVHVNAFNQGFKSVANENIGGSK